MLAQYLTHRSSINSLSVGCMDVETMDSQNGWTNGLGIWGSGKCPEVGAFPMHGEQQWTKWGLSFLNWFLCDNNWRKEGHSGSRPWNESSHARMPASPSWTLPTWQNCQLPEMKVLLRIPKSTTRAQRTRWTKHTRFLALVGHLTSLSLSPSLWNEGVIIGKENLWFWEG